MNISGASITRVAIIQVLERDLCAAKSVIGVGMPLHCLDQAMGCASRGVSRPDCELPVKGDERRFEAWYGAMRKI